MFNVFYTVQPAYENWQIKEECTGLCWCCYKCKTVRISYTNTGLYTLPLLARFHIQAVAPSCWMHSGKNRNILYDNYTKIATTMVLWLWYL